MTTPTPVTVQRISACLDDLNVNHTVGTELPGTSVTFDTDTVMTGFTNVMAFLDIVGDDLRCRASWRGLPDHSDAPKMLAAANEWNLTQITPRLSMAKDASDVIVVHIYRTWPVGAGATNEQLSSIIRAMLGMSARCADWLDTQFPEIAAEWKDEAK